MVNLLFFTFQYYNNFSDNPVELRKLDEEKNAVLIGR
jgi:hypothetical protein